MDCENKIQVNNISKVFNMYNTPMDKMREALSITGKVRHSEFYAITDLSFTVKRGEILGIMGRNGAGKSTLLKMITGIYEPTKGSITVSGKVSSLLELGTGFNLEYTGVDNIFFYGTLMGFTHKQMEEKMQSIIEFAEIGDYVYQPVKTYSSGMFARLAFSCAINVEPDILIVDEILSVGDMRFQAKCFNKFKEFKEKGVTILYVGHDVGMMRTFCDRAMWINKGKLVDIGDPTFITAKYTEFMYLDEISEFTDYKRPIQPVKNIDSQSGREDDSKCSIIAGEGEQSAISRKKKMEKDIRFPDCFAHWGKRTEIIDYVKISSRKGDTKSFYSYDCIIINVGFSIPSDLESEYVSIAFSIKNLEGTDIVVKSTYEEGIKIKSGMNQSISFETEPRLASGEYYLVVAIEDRKNRTITYYEYVEGASFFKVYSEKNIFGVFDPKAVIKY